MVTRRRETGGMDDTTSLSPEQERHLKVLRWLVTALTATMIVGLIVLIVLFVTRFPEPRATAPTATIPLPDSIPLPDGTRVTAFTRGPDWFAVVTGDNRILILDAATGALRQSITVE